MANEYAKFIKLTEKGPKSVVEITAINGDGTSNARTMNNSSIRINGDSVPVGKYAVIQEEAILYQTSDLANYVEYQV